LCAAGIDPKATPSINQNSFNGLLLPPPHACPNEQNPQQERGNMTILWWIIVGLIAGFITGKIMKGSGYGALMDIVVGIVGAIIGGYIMQSLGHAGSGGMIYTIFVAVIGAVLLTLLIRLITGRRSNL